MLCGNQLNKKNVKQFSLFSSARVVSLSLYKDKQTTIHQHIVEMLIMQIKSQTNYLYVVFLLFN